MSLKTAPEEVEFNFMKASSGPCPPRNPLRLTERRHDVLIVGGGINGAGLARDLALRGLQVVLVDQGDFASGTSSASTRLIHGGLRYLKNLDFRLVFEACRERGVLQRIAPHLVQPLPLLIPVYRDDPHSLLAVRAGLALYDLLALFRVPQRHRILAPRAAGACEPALRPEGLRGAALYWDCRTDDARLCLENVLAAVQAGAETVNYLEVVGLLKQGGRVRGARLRDRESGEELEIEAQVVVNAAGPWLDRVCALDGDTGAKLRPTRGSHILVPRINRGDEALYLTAGRDDRLFFVIPWGELSLIGTTDVDYDGDPGAVTATAADIDYLLQETARHLRGVTPARAEIVAAFAGVRPLVAGAGSASRVSREHRLFTSTSGLISIGGGKYTTYRVVAAEAARLVTERLGRGGGDSHTDRLPLPGGATGDFLPFLHRQAPLLTERYGLAAGEAETLLGRYGSRTPEMLSLLERQPELARPIVAGSPLREVEAVWAMQAEFARTPEDILRRRTPLALLPDQGGRELPALVELLGARLGASAHRRGEWRRSYLNRHPPSRKDHPDGD